MSASVVSVPSRIIDSLSSTFKSLCAEKIAECAKLYNFDAEEAIRRLDLEFTVAAVKSVAAKKEKSLEPTKKSFPMPFCGKNDGCCNALKFNHGLYTQCPSILAEGTTFCNACTKASAKTDGKMPYGTVDERLAVGLMDYRDPKGKAPTPYCKIMKKFSLTEDMVNAEAEKQDIAVDSEHFVVVEPKKGGRPKKSESDDEAAGSDTGAAKKRGRPKKAAAVQEEGASDELFASLVAEAQGNMSDSETSETKKKGKLTDEEKAAKTAEREAKKAQKEQEAAEKKAKAAQDKEEKKAAAEALKAQKEQEKLEKKAEKDAAREAKKAAEEAEREAKKAAKEAKKAQKEEEKNEKVAAKAAASAPEVSDPIPEPTEAKDSKSEPDASATAASAAATKVKKFKFGGVEYLRSGTNVVYSKDTHEEIGVWDPETKKIVLNSEDSEEEEEEEMEEGEEK